MPASEGDVVVEGKGLRRQRPVCGRNRRRDRLDDHRLLQLALILDLTERELDLLADPVLAVRSMNANKRFGVSRVQAQHLAALENNVGFVVLAFLDDRDLQLQRAVAHVVDF